MDPVPSTLGGAFTSTSGGVDRVVVLGGGRWARVMAEVACQLLPATTALMVCSPRGVNAVASWVREQRLTDRIDVRGSWPDLPREERMAVIVANAACDHAAAACWGLERGAAVLVEKPLATSLQEAQALVQYAVRRAGVLAAAHVLRFARYLETFGRLLVSQGAVRSVALDWVDPPGEQRHGEVKQYDPAVPVYLDCLPHAVSILQGIFGALPVVAGAPTVEAGGSRVVVPLTLEGRPCRVSLQRNGPARLRRVAVETESDTAVLDFSTEPGTIQLGREVIGGDPYWNSAPRPLASMLGAFFVAAAGGEVDPRLGWDAGLVACAVGDAILPSYQAAVLPWLVGRLVSGSGAEEALRYAVAELLQQDGRLTETELMSRTARLQRCLRGAPPVVREGWRADDLRRLAATGG